jgi:hypothetical protein
MRPSKIISGVLLLWLVSMPANALDAPTQSVASDIVRLRAAGKTDAQTVAALKAYPWTQYRYGDGIERLEKAGKTPTQIVDGFIAWERANEKQIAEQASKERYARDQRLCGIQKTCANYAASRQVCAVAGSFETCMRIKVTNLSEAESYCSHNGTLKYNADSVPNAFLCLLMPSPK